MIGILFCNTINHTRAKLRELSADTCVHNVFEETFVRLGHDAERGALGLVVQFMIDQLGNPATGAITREQLNRIERMLPDIPVRDRRTVGISVESEGTLQLRQNPRVERPQAADRSALAQRISCLARQILPLADRGRLLRRPATKVRLSQFGEVGLASARFI